MARKFRPRHGEAHSRLRGNLLLATGGLGMQHGAAEVTRLNTEGHPLDILLEFEPGTARRSGLKVHVGANGEETSAAGGLYRP